MSRYDRDKTWGEWVDEVGILGRRLRRVLTELAEQKVDFDGFVAGRSNTQLAVDLGRTEGNGTAQAGSTSSITLAAGDTQPDDFYNGMTLGILSGTGAGQEVAITDYVASSKIASATFSPAPDSTSVYAIQIDIDNIVSAVNNGNKIKRIAMGETNQASASDLLENVRKFT